MFNVTQSAAQAFLHIMVSADLQIKKNILPGNNVLKSRLLLFNNLRLFDSLEYFPKVVCNIFFNFLTFGGKLSISHMIFSLSSIKVYSCLGEINTIIIILCIHYLFLF